MKKTVFTIVLTIAASVGAFAQTAYDAWLFSENNYEGTARSVAMGNAFTALGGDLGGITINPAGSAVAGYSQITLTPSLTFSTNTATGVPYEGSSYFQREMKSRKVRAGIPNVGFTFNFDTGRKSGLKGLTLGFVLNQTNSWCENLYANGTNGQTSFLAAMASDATYEIEDLNYFNPNIDPPYSKNDYMNEDAFKYMNWRNTLGYRSGMFSAYDADGQKFVGATEMILDNGNLQQAGEVDQTYGREVYGAKYEYVFNIGANISDFIYLGFNLGVNTLTYDYTHYFKEAACDVSLFENKFIDSDGTQQSTYFKNAKYRYSYSAEGTGIFGKFGVIVTPGAGFRFGATIQTPTSTTIKEQWQERAETSFTDSKFNGKAESPLGDNGRGYTFDSPWRFGLGAAYTLGKIAVISADYEFANFGGMNYKTNRRNMSEDDFDYFTGINDDIRNSYGFAHYLRVGAEFKPMSQLAIRAGYNLNTSAQKKYYDSNSGNWEDLQSTLLHNISFGVGYDSKKSFFADLACRHAFRTYEYIYPYSDYLADYGIWSPEIRNIYSNWKLLLTLGWRF